MAKGQALSILMMLDALVVKLFYCNVAIVQQAIVPTQRTLEYCANLEVSHFEITKVDIINSFTLLLVDNCTDGQVRLIGGTREAEGTVEVCYNGLWGSICHASWGTSDARVVCRQLGYLTAGKITVLCCVYKQSNIVLDIVFSLQVLSATTMPTLVKEVVRYISMLYIVVVVKLRFSNAVEVHTHTALVMHQMLE